jgi:hypothetical protein
MRAIDDEAIEFLPDSQQSAFIFIPTPSHVKFLSAAEDAFTDGEVIADCPQPEFVELRIVDNDENKLMRPDAITERPGTQRAGMRL